MTPVTYTVVKGDTLDTIAAKVGKGVVIKDIVAVGGSPKIVMAPGVVIHFSVPK